MSILEVEGKVSAKEMASFFKVTQETIRNDFDSLADRFPVTRIHGGIKLEKITKARTTYRYHERQLYNEDIKRELCFNAMEYIQDGDCIYLDTGSTVTYILNFMKNKKNLCVITSSIAILIKYIMEDYAKIFNTCNHKLIFIGGEVDSNLLTTYGTCFAPSVEDFNFSKLFFSVDAIDLKEGCTNMDYMASIATKNGMKNAQKKILLADHTKFGRNFPYKISEWSGIDIIITNKELDDPWSELCQAHNIEWM